MRPDTSAAINSVDAESIQLLLRLLEAPNLSFSRSALTRFYGLSGERLVSSALLKPIGFARYAEAEETDELYEVTYDERHGGLGFYQPLQGWVSVEENTLQMFEPNLELLFTSLLGQGLKILANGFRQIEPELVWSLGQLRLGRKGPTEVWYARRLSDDSVRKKVEDATRRRPPTSLRLMLTTTDDQNLWERLLPQTSIISIADVLSPTDGPWIDPAQLSARISGTITGRPLTRIALTNDDRQLHVDGRTLIFSGKIVCSIVRQLFEGYKRGQWLRSSDILETAGSSGHSLDKAFGARWHEIRPYLENDSRGWRLTPD